MRRNVPQVPLKLFPRCKFLKRRPLECLFFHSFSLLGGVGAVLGRPWGALGFLGRSWGGLGSLLDRSWAVLGRSWAVFGWSWAVLGLALSNSFAAVGHGLVLSSSFAAVGHGFALSNSFVAFRFQLLRF